LTAALMVLVGTASFGDPPDIQVKDAWIRWLPANLPGAGYMTLTNTGSAERVLIGAASPDYEEVGMHESHSNDAMNGMTPVGSVVLKPHSTVRFTEGGYHLMLMQPKRALHPGDRVSVTLRFEIGQPVTVPFEVRAGNIG
jgi:periplasmic copper chaperone A